MYKQVQNTSEYNIHIKENIRAIMYQDFKNAAQNIRPSVSKESLKLYEQWNKEFGSK